MPVDRDNKFVPKSAGIAILDHLAVESASIPKGPATSARLLLERNPSLKALIPIANILTCPPRSAGIVMLLHLRTASANSPNGPTTSARLLLENIPSLNAFKPIASILI